MAYDAQRADMGSDDVAGSGWLTFAATLLGLAGTFNIIDGIVGLSKSKFFTTGATYVFSDLRTWSWIILFLGILQLLAAFSLFGGSEWARVVRHRDGEPERDRAAAGIPGVSVVVADDVRGRHLHHLRPGGVRRAQAAHLI